MKELFVSYAHSGGFDNIVLCHPCEAFNTVVLIYEAIKKQKIDGYALGFLEQYIEIEKDVSNVVVLNFIWMD